MITTRVLVNDGINKVTPSKAPSLELESPTAIESWFSRVHTRVDVAAELSRPLNKFSSL